MGLALVTAQVFDSGQAVHLRHDHIHQDQVRGHIAHLHQGIQAIASLADVKAQRPQQITQHGAVGGHIVDDQNLTTRAVVAHHGRKGFIGLFDGAKHRIGRRHPQIKPEQAALAQLALQPDLAPHHAHQLAGDGQAQARASGAAGAVPSLLEGLKNSVLIFGGQAHARVLYFKTQAVTSARRAAHGRDAQAHLALGRELDGIAQQVEQHLAQTLFVDRQHVRHIRRDLQLKRHALFFRLDPDDVGNAIEEVDGRHRHREQLELAGFDAGQVQDVVDQEQQMLATAVDGVQAHVLALGQHITDFEQLGIAHDGVQGGAQLVAHAGQEGALGLVGHFGTVLGVAQLARALTHHVFEVLLMALQLFAAILQGRDHPVERLGHGGNVLGAFHLGAHMGLAALGTRHHARQVFQRLR